MDTHKISTRNKWLIGGAIFLVFGVLGNLLPQPKHAERKPPPQAEKPAPKTYALAGPKPKMSKYDGSTFIVKFYLEKRLKDPDSVRYIEWSKVVLDPNKEFWAVRVKYRAKNGFGGYVIENRLAIIQHNIVVGMQDIK